MKRKAPTNTPHTFKDGTAPDVRTAGRQFRQGDTAGVCLDQVGIEEFVAKAYNNSILKLKMTADQYKELVAKAKQMKTDKHGHYTLLIGESNAHAHKITDKRAKVFELPPVMPNQPFKELIVQVPESGVLQEHMDIKSNDAVWTGGHGPIGLAPGTWHVRTQIEIGRGTDLERSLTPALD